MHYLNYPTHISLSCVFARGRVSTGMLGRHYVVPADLFPSLNFIMTSNIITSAAIDAPARGCRIAMALRRQNLSPTANLLRNSRLFSLPNPLPRPPVSETYGAGVQKASDTATL